MPSFSVLSGSEGFSVFRPRAGLSITNPLLRLLCEEPLKDQPMLKVRIPVLAVSASVLLSSPVFGASFADRVVDYAPGIGFAAGFTNPVSALGAPASTTTPFSPPFRTNQMVSIGAGGFLNLHMGNPIVHSPASPYGADFQIFGNSFFIITNGNYSGGGITDGSVYANGASTRIEVSADGATWYTLNPEQAPVVGDLFPTDGVGDPGLPVNPALTNARFAGLGLI